MRNRYVLTVTFFDCETGTTDTTVLNEAEEYFVRFKPNAKMGEEIAHITPMWGNEKLEEKPNE